MKYGKTSFIWHFSQIAPQATVWSQQKEKNSNNMDIQTSLILSSQILLFFFVIKKCLNERSHKYLNFSQANGIFGIDVR